MKKTLIFIFGFCLLFILSGCVSQSDYDSLEGENDRLIDIIDQCNSNIEDAQSYARSDYEDMGYALEELQTCDY